MFDTIVPMSIYHLHIPRSSGVFIRRTYESVHPTKKMIAGHRTQIIPSNFPDSDFISGHYALNPVRYADRTFTIVRDPVETTISYLKYNWISVYRDRFDLADFFKYQIDNEDLSKHISNMNLRFLTGHADLEKYNADVENNLINVVENGWFVKDYTLDPEKAVNIVKDNNITVMFYDDPNLYRKVFDILDIRDIDNAYLLNKINDTSFMDNRMFADFYDKIKEINKPDIEFYNLLRRDYPC